MFQAMCSTILEVASILCVDTLSDVFDDLANAISEAFL